MLLPISQKGEMISREDKISFPIVDDKARVGKTMTMVTIHITIKHCLDITVA
jgi:hypothetical protein